MSEIAEVIRKCLGVLEDDFSEKIRLLPGASSQALELLESDLDTQLPEQLRDFLTFCNGESYKSPPTLFGTGSQLFGMDDVRVIREQLVSLSLKSNLLDKNEEDSWKCDSRVQPSHWRTKWIPFWQPENVWAIDLDPALPGKIGQVISVTWDDGRIEVHYPSLLAMFEHFLTQLRSGNRKFVPFYSMD